MEKSEKKSIEGTENPAFEKIYVKKETLSLIVDILEEKIDVSLKISKLLKIDVENLLEIVVATYVFFLDEVIGRCCCSFAQKAEKDANFYMEASQKTLTDEVFMLSLKLQSFRTVSQNSFLTFLLSFPVLMSTGAFDLYFLIELSQYIVRRDHISLKDFIENSEKAIELFLIVCKDVDKEDKESSNFH